MSKSSPSRNGLGNLEKSMTRYSEHVKLLGDHIKTGKLHIATAHLPSNNEPATEYEYPILSAYLRMRATFIDVFLELFNKLACTKSVPVCDSAELVSSIHSRVEEITISDPANSPTAEEVGAITLALSVHQEPEHILNGIHLMSSRHSRENYNDFEKSKAPDPMARSSFYHNRRADVKERSTSDPQLAEPMNLVKHLSQLAETNYLTMHSPFTKDATARDGYPIPQCPSDPRTSNLSISRPGNRNEIAMLTAQVPECAKLLILSKNHVKTRKMNWMKPHLPRTRDSNVKFLNLLSDTSVHIPVEFLEVKSKVTAQILHREKPTLNDWKLELSLTRPEFLPNRADSKYSRLQGFLEIKVLNRW
ncbi:hypothetical protein BS47DRAFT_1397199 [Hydnum rufescens UP504]|uniref:Uncharacterized protein n=1 Tax=Hydnum rufescens UP504 TaxID=1448309 RepID=A0A9P6DS51_9AGAM|nr:hypothetical protein BS47DRAFT_1397199 [Hydnum rufescens UP504]